MTFKAVLECAWATHLTHTGNHLFTDTLQVLRSRRGADCSTSFDRRTYVERSMGVRAFRYEIIIRTD